VVWEKTEIKEEQKQ